MGFGISPGVGIGGSSRGRIGRSGRQGRYEVGGIVFGLHSGSRRVTEVRTDGKRGPQSSGTRSYGVTGGSAQASLNIAVATGAGRVSGQSDLGLGRRKKAEIAGL